MRRMKENKSECMRFRAGEEAKAISRLVLITFQSFFFFFIPPPQSFQWSPLPAPHLEALRCQNYFISMSAFTTSEGGMQGTMYEPLIRPNYESWLRLLISQASTSAGEGGSDGEDSRRERWQREGGSEEGKMCQGGRGSGKTANVKGQYIYMSFVQWFFLSLKFRIPPRKYIISYIRLDRN